MLYARQGHGAHPQSPHYKAPELHRIPGSWLVISAVNALPHPEKGTRSSFASFMVSVKQLKCAEEDVIRGWSLNESCSLN